MDIDKNLQRQLELAKEIRALREEDAAAQEAHGEDADLHLDQLAEYAEELADLVLAADEWLGEKRGFLPAAWGSRGVCYSCGSSCGCDACSVYLDKPSFETPAEPTDMVEIIMTQLGYPSEPRAEGLDVHAPIAQGVGGFFPVHETSADKLRREGVPTDDAVAKQGAANMLGLILAYIAENEPELDHQEPEGSEVWNKSIAEFLGYLNEYAVRFGNTKEVDDQINRLEARRVYYPSLISTMSLTELLECEMRLTE